MYFGLLFVSYKYGFLVTGTISLNAPVTFPVDLNMKDTTINISVRDCYIARSSYIRYIWPVSDLAIQTAAESGLAVPRTFAVILKDLEQEVCTNSFCELCFNLFEDVIHYEIKISL